MRFAAAPLAIPLAIPLLVLFASLMLPGCEQAETLNTHEPAYQVSVREGMGGSIDPGFKRADRPRPFDFPRDHGAHPAFATEWWYFTGNLASASGRRFGYQLTLFRIALKPGDPAPGSAWRATQVYMGHLALSDIQGDRHHASERFGRAAAGLAGAEHAPLRVWLGDWSITGSDQAEPFPLKLQAGADDIAIDLSLEAGDKPRILQGEQGWSRKSADPGNASYYYSYTRLPSSGQLRIGEQRFEVQGDSWFDREWSSSALADDQAGWDWFSLQLDDGRDLMFYRMRDQQGQAQTFSRGVLIDRQGNVVALDLDNTNVAATGHWQNAEGARYPIAWRLQVPSEAIDLRVRAAIEDQEMDLSVRYWEGAVTVSGTQRGVGYLELSGYDAATR